MVIWMTHTTFGGDPYLNSTTVLFDIHIQYSNQRVAKYYKFIEGNTQYIINFTDDEKIKVCVITIQ